MPDPVAATARLDHAGLSVRDLAAAAAWYRGSGRHLVELLSRPRTG
jgi:catechol 2,3-dioxygenase-like lactoylglutathione lyase family enzyme